jgi:histone H3/H4
MDNIKKVTIKRLAECAGVKSLGDDCYDVIREIIEEQVKEVVRVGHLLMIEDNSKTLSNKHIQLSLEYSGHNFLFNNNSST